MARRSKAYQEGMARLSASLAEAKTNIENIRTTQRELAEGKTEIAKDTDWLVNVPKELQNAGLETQNAPTTNPERPRAWTIAYNPNLRKLRAPPARAGSAAQGRRKGSSYATASARAWHQPAPRCLGPPWLPAAGGGRGSWRRSRRRRAGRRPSAAPAAARRRRGRGAR